MRFATDAVGFLTFAKNECVGPENEITIGHNANVIAEHAVLREIKFYRMENLGWVPSCDEIVKPVVNFSKRNLVWRKHDLGIVSSN